MSRGRGGPYKEHYHKHPPFQPQAKENYNRSGPALPYSRGGRQQIPHSGYYNSPTPPVVSIQPPAPLLIPSAPPIPGHIKAAPKPEGHNSSHSQHYSPGPAPNSFQYQQAEFLRGHSSEAPQFRASPRGGGGGGVVPGRPPVASYHPQSVYSRYPNFNTSRGRGGYSHDQSFACPPSVGPLRGPQCPQHVNQNQLQSKNYNQYHYNNRQWHLQTDSLCDSYQRLSLHQDRTNRGERFDRHSASSSSKVSSYRKGNITLTSDIQDQVHRALAALGPSESISAKLLAKKLRLPKKIVNKALYTLERSQKASKQGLTPPEWTVYRESLRSKEDQSSEIQSPPSHPCASSGHAPQPEAKVELKTETPRNRGQAKEEDSDTESSSSYSSSLESSDSEASRSPAQGQREEKEHPGTTSSPDQELLLPMMAEQKELVLRYLLESGKASALVIAKNLGLRGAKHVNPTLYALEKQGDVTRTDDSNPSTWELSTHRRERMERSLKAAQSTLVEGAPIKEEPHGEEEGGESIFLPSPPLPPMPGLEPMPLPEGWMPEKSHSEVVGKSAGCCFVFLSLIGDSRGGSVLSSICQVRLPSTDVYFDLIRPFTSLPFPSQSQSSLQPLPFTSCQDKETNEQQWASDEIPEFLNAIRRETDAEKLAAERASNMGTVAVSLAAPPPQNLWAKLQEVRLKNPVSGLMEYAQYLGHNCEFQLLDQSGPSHDPRLVT